MIEGATVNEGKQYGRWSSVLATYSMKLVREREMSRKEGYIKWSNASCLKRDVGNLKNRRGLLLSKKEGRHSSSLFNSKCIIILIQVYQGGIKCTSLVYQYVLSVSYIGCMYISKVSTKCIESIHTLFYISCI